MGCDLHHALLVDRAIGVDGLSGSQATAADGGPILAHGHWIPNVIHHTDEVAAQVGRPLLGQFREERLVVYGRAVVLAHAGIDLRVRIAFEIRIGLPFGRSIRISWSQEWNFSLQIHADLQLEVAVTSHGELGMRGQATLSVNVIGIQASISVPAQLNAPLIDDARLEADEVRKDIQALIG